MAGTACCVCHIPPYKHAYALMLKIQPETVGEHDMKWLGITTSSSSRPPSASLPFVLLSALRKYVSWLVRASHRAKVLCRTIDTQYLGLQYQLATFVAFHHYPPQPLQSTLFLSIVHSRTRQKWKKKKKHSVMTMPRSLCKNLADELS